MRRAVFAGDRAASGCSSASRSPNAGLCGSGIAAAQAWLPEALERLHVTFVDATPMLRAVASSAFLRDSYHLAPEGHDAHLAALMATTIAKACGEAAGVVAECRG